MATDLDGRAIKPMRICVIGAGGFIGSHLCESLMKETAHTVVTLDIDVKRKIKDLVGSFGDRLQFHSVDLEHHLPMIQKIIMTSDLTIYVPAAIRSVDDYYTMLQNYFDSLLVIKFCSKNMKRLLLFSTCRLLPEVAEDKEFTVSDDGKRIASREFILHADCGKKFPSFLPRDEQLLEVAGNGLEFTIIRPFNWMGPRMDFIPGIDGPSKGVLAYNLVKGKPLKLVGSGGSTTSFLYIMDAIHAVILMIENPRKVNRQIVNVGNPSNEITLGQFGEMMTKVYASLNVDQATVDQAAVDQAIVGVTGSEDVDLDLTIPDCSLITDLGWKPVTCLHNLS